jgi:NADPH-dependent curcumin reductase CurA
MYGWRPPFQLGEALEGGAIGEVAASDDPRFKPGDLVSSWLGWRERFNASAGTLQKLDTFGLPPQAFLGVAGMLGLTAWVGLLKIAMLKPGDVVFVSAASGTVGSVVCQIAKLKGHTHGQATWTSLPGMAHIPAQPRSGHRRYGPIRCSDYWL